MGFSSSRSTLVWHLLERGGRLARADEGNTFHRNTGRPMFSSMRQMIVAVRSAAIGPFVAWEREVQPKISAWDDKWAQTAATPTQISC
ncbi:protein of unknown function [Candidatus Filomicrobium marinum]|uniref:Uncharacterized protein n=1 Tax=Candidatus Filomicrobium marinum TaxID=1608628 RepID=A0A0D6JK77_9HYPH|nr:protein of unknown function [Candidatus Filomicrobium marinum]CPR22368.1 protein of unknown function [Candidatus Filomicrobium marinum]